MKVTGNVKYIPAGTTQYIVDGSDGEINVDASLSAITIILPNIINSGYTNSDKGFIINDISGNAATNNITITAINNTVNSQSSILIASNGGTAKCSIASMNEWFAVTEPTTSGMSGNLTANYIPKAVTSSTLGNSVIYQNGSNIGINTTNPLTKLTVSANDQSALISSVRYETVGSSPAGIVSLRARGTDLLPTALVTGDEIATFAAVGYYGAGFGTTGNANFIFYAAENFTLTNRGTSCKVGTTPLGTSSVVYNFGINSEGNVSIGIPSLNPTARVQIKGVDATSSNYALKVDNSASSPLLYVRNDGNVYSHGFGGISSNTSFGLDSLIAVSGLYNSAFGTNSLKANSTGTGNCAFGFESLKVNTSGDYSTSIGTQALYSNTIGASNTAIGSAAMALNVSGTANTAIGKSALYNSTINGNTAIGNQSLQTLSTGSNNTAIGNQSGLNATGSGNVFIGYLAGASETGSNKLFIDNQVRTNEATARVESLIYGIFGATTANQVLTINAAKLQTPYLQTGNAGLTTGDMYVDTAANVLANGDKVVGWKV